MLRLTPDQAAALAAIAMRRGQRRVGEALALAFPDLPPRLGDRYPALILRGVEAAGARGMRDAVCVARYIVCLAIWGLDFESRTDFKWTERILADDRRSEGAKAFQIIRRSREELERRASQPPKGPPLPLPAAFDAAIRLLDAELEGVGALGALQPGPGVRLGEPCDLDAVDIRLVEAGWRHRYEWTEGAWKRLQCTPEDHRVTLNTANQSEAALAWPARLHLISRPAGKPPAALRVRSRALHCCDAEVHPQLVWNGPQGIVEWRGAHAAEQTLRIASEPAVADAPPPERLQPPIAAEGAPASGLLSFATCGLRDAGPAFGEVRSEVQAYPADQVLLVWRREPGPKREWPVDDGAPPPARPAARVKLDRDGLPLDASRWQAALEELDRQLDEGLARLFGAWERESGLLRTRLAAEPRVMTGSAALTWGWADHPRGITMPPWMRVDGPFDLVAAALGLQLVGELVLADAHVRLRLQAPGEALLKGNLQRSPFKPDWVATLKPAQVAFRHPFVLDAEPLADEAPALVERIGPVTGSVQGRCGLRLRNDGPGLQWFALIEIEAATVQLRVTDPLLGRTDASRPLLPAMTLLDWSFG